MKFFDQKYFPLRFTIYLVVVGLLFHFINVLVGHFGWRWAVPEKGFLEYGQIAMLASIFFGLTFLSIVDKDNRSLFGLLAFLTFAAMIRENNNHPYYNALIPGAWKAILGSVVIVFFVAKQPRKLFHQVVARFNQPAFLMQLLGFGVAVLWAQTLAQKELLPEKADRAIEESMELGGYLLIFFGLLEDYFSWRRRCDSFSNSRSGKRITHRKMESVH